MAKIKFGGPIMDARNKLAGIVFSANTHGAYIRRRVTPVNVATVAQLLVRQRFTTNSQAWRSLTEDERKGFIEQKDNFKTTDIFGDLKSPTGQNLFIKLNQNILQISETPITAVPIPSAVQGFTNLSVVVDSGVDLLTITFDPAIDAAVKVLVFATAPLSPGVNFVKADFRIITVLNSTDTSPVSLETQYIAKFGALAQIGAKVFIQMRPILIGSGIPGTLIKTSGLAV